MDTTHCDETGLTVTARDPSPIFDPAINPYADPLPPRTAGAAGLVKAASELDCLRAENAKLRAALVTALGALDVVACIEPDCGHNHEINLANRAIARIGRTGEITWREVKDARAALGSAS